MRSPLVRAGVDPLRLCRVYCRLPLALIDERDELGMDPLTVYVAMCCQADRWTGRAFSLGRLCEQVGRSGSQVRRLLARAYARGWAVRTPGGPDWGPTWRWATARTNTGRPAALPAGAVAQPAAAEAQPAAVGHRGALKAAVDARRRPG